MRYERKYKNENLSLAMTHQSIRSHPAGLRKIFPDRQINNIYFDTPGLTAYHENVVGVASRKKFRVRWYGSEKEAIQNPHLEIKIKDNELGFKKTFPVAPFSWTSLTALQKEVASKSESYAVLNPVLVNAYLRSYYGTPDGKFRITLDSNLRYFPLLGARRFTRFNILDQGVIVELKYEEEWENQVDRIRQFLPFRQTKSSKYVTGMNSSGIMV